MRFNSSYLYKTIISFSILAAFALAYVVYGQFIDLHEKFTKYSSIISKNSAEERKEIQYRNMGIGYRYIVNVVKLIPEKRIFPILRTQDWGKGERALMPSYRDKFDPRILVGINVINNKPVSPVSGKCLKNKPMNLLNLNAMDRALIGIKFPPKIETQSAEYHFILINPEGCESLTDWKIKAADIDQGGQYWLPQPYVSESSESRNLLLTIESESKPINFSYQVSVYTWSNNFQETFQFSDYAIIHKNDCCFTALKRDFLANALEGKEISWANFYQKASRNE